MEGKTPTVADLNERSREIFRRIVENFLETGEPMGSRTVSRVLPMALSPASVRNVMSDLEQLGLLYAPHTSAGRLPTELGLRMFVDGLLEVGDLSEEERENIERQLSGTSSDRTVEDMLSEVSRTLSGLSHCAGLVTAPKLNTTGLKHIEFVSVGPGRTLVVMVSENGNVENRIIDAPAGITPSALAEASNYLNARLRGRTLKETREQILQEIAERKTQIDQISARIVEAGLAKWSGEGDGSEERTLIVRGQSNLLEDLNALEDLERIRRLFDDLESKRDLIGLLDLAREADGVRIFIGSETQLFGLSGSSLIVSPYMNARQKIVGVIGVIGPTRLNYARIVPMVDYTAKIMSRLLT
ncbi:MAG: heat-inducible transcriptional repressor HrcA [Alphaproteobacteria bacterium]